jgi:hypothetical protein
VGRPGRGGLPAQDGSSNTLVSVLIVVIAILLGIIAGLVGYGLAKANGSSVPSAIEVGAVAFAGMVGLAVTNYRVFK